MSMGALENDDAPYRTWMVQAIMPAARPSIIPGPIGVLIILDAQTPPRPNLKQRMLRKVLGPCVGDRG